MTQTRSDCLSERDAAAELGEFQTYVRASAWSLSSPPSLDPGTMSRSTARFSSTLTMVATAVLWGVGVRVCVYVYVFVVGGR